MSTLGKARRVIRPYLVSYPLQVVESLVFQNSCVKLRLKPREGDDRWPPNGSLSTPG